LEIPGDYHRSSVLEVSYSVLPRRGLRRKKAPPLDLANANIIETGWPGKTNITT
jgi:hypothetical protein